MSQWTHVSGCIRYDAYRIDDAMEFVKTEEDVKKLLGTTFGYKDYQYAYDGDLPYGSEGSIQYNIVENPKSLLAAFTVCIWGDLRDFGSDDVEYIRKWFARITTKEGLMVRSAILLVDVEYVGSILFVLENDRIKEIKFGDHAL